MAGLAPSLWACLLDPGPTGPVGCQSGSVASPLGASAPLDPCCYLYLVQSPSFPHPFPSFLPSKINRGFVQCTVTPWRPPQLLGTSSSEINRGFVHSTGTPGGLLLLGLLRHRSTAGTRTSGGIHSLLVLHILRQNTRGQRFSPCSGAETPDNL